MKNKRRIGKQDANGLSQGNPEIAEAYNTIAELFDFGNIEYYRSFIRKLCEYASLDKVYGKQNPSNTVFALERIESLLHATNTLNDSKMKTCLIIDDHEILNTKYYSRSRSVIEDWESFPRMLSVKEFKNPYIVFKKLFKLQDLEDWKITLNEILHLALSRNPLEFESGTLSVFVHLTKMVEAASLINLREIIHINGKLKGV